jgi:hypothetical protein
MTRAFSLLHEGIRKLVRRLGIGVGVVQRVKESLNTIQGQPSALTCIDFSVLTVQ